MGDRGKFVIKTKVTFLVMSVIIQVLVLLAVNIWEFGFDHPSVQGLDIEDMLFLVGLYNYTLIIGWFFAVSSRKWYLVALQGVLTLVGIAIMPSWLFLSFHHLRSLFL